MALDPMSMMMLASGGMKLAGAASSLFGGNKAANAQNDLNYQNFYLQRAMANQQQQMAQAGSRDALGNSTEYVPGVGWRTNATPETLNVQRAQQGEQRQSLTQDAIRNRLASQQQFTRGQQAGGAASAELAQLRTPSQTRSGQLGRTIEAGVATANSGGDNARRAIAMRRARSGMGGDQLAALGAESGPTTRAAIAQARLTAPQQYDDAEAQRRTGIIQRAGGLGQVAQGRPSELMAVENTTDADRRGRAFAGGQQMAAIRLPNAPQLNALPGIGASLGATGAALSGFGKTAASGDYGSWLQQLLGGK